MWITGTSDPVLSESSHPGGHKRRRAGRTLSLAAVAVVALVGPGSYAAATGAAAHGTAASARTGKNKHKHKHCKKGFVFQHGRCVAKTTGPTY
jgi:hypothetical protein